MTINKDKVVALEYTLTVNGEVIESVKAEKPLRFIFGAGTLLPKFEENVLEKSVGDAFEFRLEAEEAYGEVNKEMIVEIPKSAFEVDGKFDSEMIAVGKVLQGHFERGGAHGIIFLFGLVDVAVGVVMGDALRE